MTIEGFEVLNHLYFMNDPLEVESLAITLINDRKFLNTWTKRYFVNSLGPKIVSIDDFVGHNYGAQDMNVSRSRSECRIDF